jgi:predicted nucleotide-binding protein
MTIIQKFEKHANQATAAVCILTPDDLVVATGTDEEKRRARQNVILEMGYFFGYLGRRHVILLHRGEVEIPSDIYGITYIKFEQMKSAEGELDAALRQLRII